MTFDKPSLIVAIAILAVAVLNWAGVLTDDLSYAGFIATLVMGFATSRQEVCRLKGNGCAA